MAPGEGSTREYSGQDDVTAALVAPRPIEECGGLLQAVHRPTIVPLGHIGHAKVPVHQRVQNDILASCGEREGALGSGDGLIIGTDLAEMVCQKARNLSQPTRVVEGLRDGLGLVQICQDTPKVARR